MSNIEAFINIAALTRKISRHQIQLSVPLTTLYHFPYINPPLKSTIPP